MSLIGIIASQNYPRTFSVEYLVVAGGASGSRGGATITAGTGNVSWS
jgi:hypothetical protein